MATTVKTSIDYTGSGENLGMEFPIMAAACSIVSPVSYQATSGAAGFWEFEEKRVIFVFGGSARVSVDEEEEEQVSNV